MENPKYRANKKNGGVIPPLPLDEFGKPDERVKYVPIGCGRCMQCKKQKANEWKIRLLEEIKVNKNGKFITLTFSTESIKELDKAIEGDLSGYDRDNEMVTIAMRRFLERWRKFEKKSVRHWFVTELGHGKFEHIHLHGILFTDKEPKYITDRWGYGIVWNGDEHNGYVNNKTVNYMVKYVNKLDKEHEYYNPKILCSKGIGKYYEKDDKYNDHKYKGKNTEDTYRLDNGRKIANPIYYRNMLYNENERERLWLDKLDKDERWVMNIKAVDDEHYYKLLKSAQYMNMKLGYGNNEINWNKRMYENQKRNIIRKQRLK
jgi:hypothetical protein